MLAAAVRAAGPAQLGLHRPAPPSSADHSARSVSGRSSTGGSPDRAGHRRRRVSPVPRRRAFGGGDQARRVCPEHGGWRRGLRTVSGCRPGEESGDRSEGRRRDPRDGPPRQRLPGVGTESHECPGCARLGAVRAPAAGRDDGRARPAARAGVPRPGAGGLGAAMRLDEGSPAPCQQARATYRAGPVDPLSRGVRERRVERSSRQGVAPDRSRPALRDTLHRRARGPHPVPSEPGRRLVLQLVPHHHEPAGVDGGGSAR